MAQIKVHSFMDNEASEAVLEISCTEATLMAYSWMNSPPEKDGEVCLHAFMCEEIVRADGFKPPERLDSDFAYNITAKVSDVSLHSVVLGDITIVLDAKIPGDISAGEYVSFNTMRLDY